MFVCTEHLVAQRGDPRAVCFKSGPQTFVPPFHRSLGCADISRLTLINSDREILSDGVQSEG